MIDLDKLEDDLIGISNCDPGKLPFLTGYSPEHRQFGLDMPSTALSMIGKHRMHQLRMAVETVLAEDIPGDLIETGVWRGGACLMMRKVLEAHGDTKRKVYIADSFIGLPKPDPRYKADQRVDPICDLNYALAISLEEVQNQFEPNDPQVIFVKGWFKDTLPLLDTQFSLIRLDGDMYESTMNALDGLYHKLSPGGFVIIDDYYCLPECKLAVEDFRTAHGITTLVINIDGSGAYWRKQ